MKVEEPMTAGPNGERVKLVSIEEDVHIDKTIKKTAIHNHPKATEMETRWDASHQNHEKKYWFLKAMQVMASVTRFLKLI